VPDRVCRDHVHVQFAERGAVPHAVVPIIIATGLIFGGITQLAAALIQIGSGDTLNGALFATFASFWIVLPTPNGPARSPARPSPAACHPPSSPSTGPVRQREETPHAAHRSPGPHLEITG
jgi:hypothetical protein